MNSRIVLGTAQIGLDYGINNNGQITLAETKQILGYCNRHGIDFLDTSNAYGDAENRLGEIIKENGLGFSIISKLGKCNTDAVAEKIESTFQNLNVSKLYGYLCHQFDFFLSDKKIWNHFLKLQDEGKAQKIGFSLYKPEELEWLIDHKIRFDIIQVPYNIFDQRFAEYFNQCRDMGIEVHVRSVFLQGLFFKKIDTLSEFFKPVVQKLQQLHQYASGCNIRLEHLLLWYVMKNSLVDKFVIGVDSLDNLKDNLEAAKISDAEIDYNFLDSFKESDLNILIPSNWKK